MDLVDHILTDWQRERPDIDTAAKGPMSRLVRLFNLFQQLLERQLRPLGIKPNEFYALGCLRRRGKGAEVPLSVLGEEVLFTSGALTNLVNRLVSNGLVEKKPGQQDRRQVLVRLTDEGLDLIDRAMEEQAMAENRFMRGLTDQQSGEITELFKAWLRTVR